MPVPKNSNRPDILFFILINKFLKKLMIDPMITTGCILPGSSPNTKSITNAKINDNIINKNNSNEIILLTFVNNISLINLLYSIIVYNIYNKKINNLL